MTENGTTQTHAAFIWSVADLLRGDYKQSEYGRVILPLTVLRRLDCVLDPVKADMLAEHERLAGRVDNFGPVLDRLTEIKGLWNTSRFDLPKLLDDPDNLADNLRAYIHGFSPKARDILDKFDFPAQIARLDKAKLLYLVVSKFAEVELHPDRVSNIEMGYLYEELIRRFSELSNETAGEHFTPREVIGLMVELLFAEDDELLRKPGIVKTLFDPACGTGGMLSVAEDRLRQLNPDARLEVYGQELNDETYAVCRSDMMLKGQDASNIASGNSFSEDGHHGARFDYLLANPPFGVEWKKVKDEVIAEHEQLGFAGRFGAGTPRINDGSFLFLQHMISKMKTPEQGGSRLAIVFNGSPLFTGAAGSGESEIRRWIIENDWLEAVVALPDQLFYNTGISTYFWIVTNRKTPNRRGQVQLIDARDSFTKMRKSLGEKRKEVAEDQVAEIVRLYGNFDHQESEADEARVKIFPNESFGFLRITVERPLRLRWEVTDDTIEALKEDKKFAKLDEPAQATIVDRVRDLAGPIPGQALTEAVRLAMSDAGVKGKPLQTAIVDAFAVSDPEAEVFTDEKGNPEPDSNLRDNENVPLPPDRVRYEPDPAERLATDTYVKAVEQYAEAEVHPYVPDAWVHHTKTKIGYEIPLTRHFYVYTPPRPLEEIDAEIKQLETEIQALLAEVTE
ncbi:MAG: class I SAM-dependent DNA methyltransferase [Actinomycetota bacterium]